MLVPRKVPLLVFHPTNWWTEAQVRCKAVAPCISVASTLACASNKWRATCDFVCVCPVLWDLKGQVSYFNRRGCPPNSCNNQTNKNHDLKDVFIRKNLVGFSLNCPRRNVFIVVLPLYGTMQLGWSFQPSWKILVKVKHISPMTWRGSQKSMKPPPSFSYSGQIANIFPSKLDNTSRLSRSQQQQQQQHDTITTFPSSWKITKKKHPKPALVRNLGNKTSRAS